jgi:uncharacterized protein (DUF697 family)
MQRRSYPPSSITCLATPLAFLDFIPLMVIQGAMVLSIARIYNYRITLARVKEIIASFGEGILGRTLLHEISKLGVSWVRGCYGGGFWDYCGIGIRQSFVV